MVDILHEGVTYRSVEHAYQCTKALHHGNVSLAAQLASLHNPMSVMKEAKKKTVFPDHAWLMRRVDLMHQLLLVKYRVCADYRNALGGADFFVEDTSNSFWGRGFNNRGYNTLGKLHQRVKKDALAQKLCAA